MPADLDVEVAFDDMAGPAFGDRGFWVEYAKTEAPPPEPAAAKPTLEVTVLKGAATQRVYELDGDRIYLGRLEEVTDSDGRVRRRNDVAFREGG